MHYCLWGLKTTTTYHNFIVLINALFSHAVIIMVFVTSFKTYCWNKNLVRARFVKKGNHMSWRTTYFVLKSPNIELVAIRVQSAHWYLFVPFRSTGIWQAFNDLLLRLYLTNEEIRIDHEMKPFVAFMFQLILLCCIPLQCYILMVFKMRVCLK